MLFPSSRRPDAQLPRAQQYASSPQANWKSKDTAIFLLTSIATRGSTQQQGVTSTNALVDVIKFFSEHILADLQAAPGSVHPVVQADAIKFLFTFRMQVRQRFSVPVPCGRSTR